MTKMHEIEIVSNIITLLVRIFHVLEPKRSVEIEKKTQMKHLPKFSFESHNALICFGRK